MTTDTKPSPDQLQSFFAELGRCLYLYQSIEFSLKLLLPHMRPSGAAPPTTDDSFDNWRCLLDSKTTLGPLVQLLRERIESDDKLMIEEAWQQLVEHRNEVVHHFLTQPFGHLRNVKDFEQAMRFLTQRRQFAAPLFKMLQQLVATFATILDDIDANESPSH